jgi:ABC-type branched-subunit amino acid transport system permease subunit
VTVHLSVVILGLTTGMAIGALAMGLVLIYRASRVVNLAQVEVGALAAAATAALVRDHHVPYGWAAAVAVAGAAAVGAVVDIAVIRRLRRSAGAVAMIATVGITQLLLAAGILIINSITNRGGGYPAPFSAVVQVAGATLHAPDLLILVVVPVLALLLGAWLRRSAVGQAVRAASDNREAAQLAGIPVDRVVTLVWAVAAAVSAVVTLILLAGRPIVGSEALGPEVLFEALAAAVLARFTSLPRALAGGLVIGVVAQVVFYNWPSGVADLVVFLIVVVALLVQHRSRARDDPRTEWPVAATVRSAPRALLAGGRARGWLVTTGAVAGLAAVAALSRLATNARTLTYTEITAYAMLAVSTTLVIGVAGHVSLGQVGFFGLGAAVSYQLSASAGFPFWLALLGAAVVVAAASMVVGIPSLRLSGLLFAVTTLGFALVAESWLLPQPWLLGPGVLAPRPVIGPVDLAAQRPYFALALIGLAVAAWITRNLIRSGPGRRIVALRDNEAGAAAFAVPVVRTRLLAFAVAGFVAGLAGAVYGHGLQSFSASDFPVGNPGLQGAVDSLQMVAIAVIGGLGSIAGAIAAAVIVVGIDTLTSSVPLQLAASSVGLIVLLLLFPGGLASLMASLRTVGRRLILRPAVDGPQAT